MTGSTPMFSEFRIVDKYEQEGFFLSTFRTEEDAEKYLQKQIKSWGKPRKGVSTREDFKIIRLDFCETKDLNK